MRSSSRGEPRLLPWASGLTAWALFELPTALAPDGLSARFVRPTGEVLVWWTAYALSFRLRRGAALRAVIAATVVVLATVRVDRAVFHVVSRAEPLFYDQLFLLKHAYILASDLSGAPVVLVALVVLALAVATAFLVRALVRGARPLFESPLPASTRTAGVLLWASVLAGTALGGRGKTPWIHWLTPDVVRNVAESRKVYAAVTRGMASSPYREYERLRLARRPDVFLFFVESYGRLVARDPELGPRWADAMRDIESRLSSSGWRARSAFSTAPVSGGRSWLAVGSILLGTRIRYEAEFRHLLHGSPSPPSLVGFLAAKGYETIDLAPSNRVRPGLPAENPYGYARSIGYLDLDYRGPKMGWGLIPDQYSLGYAEEHYLRVARHPLLLQFHMVSSHAPWRDLPELVSDWHALADGRPIPKSEVFGGNFRRLQTYARLHPEDSYMGRLTGEMREGYERSVLYDLRVLSDFLQRLRNDALVIVMGDHQPPVVSPEAEDFDVPVHVLARDETLLAELGAEGFSPGLALAGDEPARVEHAGLFSLLVRALAIASGVEPPPFLRRGVVLGD